LVSGKSGAGPALFPFQWDSRLSLQVRVVILIFDCKKARKIITKSYGPNTETEIQPWFRFSKTRFRSYVRISSRLSPQVQVIVLVFDCNKSRKRIQFTELQCTDRTQNEAKCIMMLHLGVWVRILEKFLMNCILFYKIPIISCVFSPFPARILPRSAEFFKNSRRKSTTY
jgi:hypothetical protein